MAAINGEGIKKTDMYYVPHTKLKVLEGFNDREDYGTAEEMEELAESIYQVGVKTPIKGYKEGEFYVVVQGHRRHRAGDMIKAKYRKTIIYPFITYPKGTTKKDLLLDTLLTNSGKDLTPLEKASTVSKLIEEQVPVKVIAGALGGVSEVYVRNLERLWKVPEKAKEMIRKGIVSATLIMGHLKSKDSDIEAFINEIEKQAKEQDKTGKKNHKKKTAKVTAKNAKKENRAASSLGEFKRFRKQHNDIFQNKAKQEAFEFFCSIIDNQVSYTQILEFFTGK
jgi:ParB/RepB/Spo0J family partition protein